MFWCKQFPVVFPGQQHVVFEHDLKRQVSSEPVRRMGDHIVGGGFDAKKRDEIAKQRPFPGGVEFAPSGDAVNIGW